jgi:hypothetical protein
MRKNAVIHARIAGHRPRGPFKHFWGEAGRFAGTEATPYSLFLACGVPFEVVERPRAAGYAFLDNVDARALAPRLAGRPASHCVVRNSVTSAGADFRVVPEELDALFRFRAEVLEQFPQVPRVQEEIPAMLAWYPSAHAVVLWNPTTQPHAYSVSGGGEKATCALAGLDLALLDWPPATVVHVP